MAGHRKELRLRTWDYSSNSCYHVVFCTHDRRCLLSHVCRQDDESYVSELSDVGRLVEKALAQAASQYASVAIDVSSIMPNHVHLLVSILGEDDARVLLGRFVSFAKSGATRLARAIEPGLKLWQRGYYDHIIRDDDDYYRVWEYIENNPANWADDEYFAN